MKKFLSVLCLCAVLISGAARSVASGAAAQAVPTDPKLPEHSAVTVMLPGIKSAVNTFYGQYLNQLPEISIPDTRITDITAYNGGVFFDVTVETKPVIAANVPIGQDRIRLFVDVFGLVTAEKFEHLCNIDLPEPVRDRLIKPLPEKTVADLPDRTQTRRGIEARPDNEMTKDQKLDALLRVLVIAHVQNAVNVFYAPYLPPPQMNAYFGYTIAELAARDDSLQITVTITPYVGAHNAVGKEKITMDIRPDGVVFVTEYEHLETYGIVPWLKDMLKNPLPQGTQQ